MTISNKGESIAEIKILNASLGAASIGVMMGFAFAAGRFEAVMDTVSGGEVSIDNLTITNNYTSKAMSEVTPAAGGVVSFVNIGVNAAVAANTTRVRTGLTGGGSVTAGDTIQLLGVRGP